jgi:hypothetical protein
MNMASEPRLHRVILHLRQGTAERAIIRAAAELAQMLGVALHGVYLEDEALPELAALPFIREFRLGTGSWQRLDRQRLAEEQREAAAEARRLLDEAAGALGVTRLFEIISGDPGLFVAATSQGRRRHRGGAATIASGTAGASGGAGWRRRMTVPPRSAIAAGAAAADRDGGDGGMAESDPALGIAARIAVAAEAGAAAAGLGSTGAGDRRNRAGARSGTAGATDRRPQRRGRDAGGRRARSGHKQRAPGGAGARRLRHRQRRGVVAYRGVARRSCAGSGTVTMRRVVIRPDVIARSAATRQSPS